MPGQATEERIEQVAGDHELGSRPIPFVCECADTSCVTLVRLTPADCRQATRNRVASLRTGVEQQRGHLVVEKQGRAGEVDEELAGG